PILVRTGEAGVVAIQFAVRPGAIGAPVFRETLVNSKLESRVFANRFRCRWIEVRDGFSIARVADSEEFVALRVNAADVFNRAIKRLAREASAEDKITT